MLIEKYTTATGEVRWKCTHDLGIDQRTGTPKKLTYSGFHTESEAQAKLLALLQNEDLILANPSSDLRFKTVAQRWLGFYKKQVKVTTYTNRKSLINNHIFPYFNDQSIEHITIAQCQQAVEHWYTYFAEAQRLADLVTTIFRFAISQGYCTDNPMAKTIRPRNTYKKDYQAPFYDKGQLQQFLQAVKAEEPLRAYTMLHTLAFTGLRRGELFALQWRDLDFDTKVLTVERNLIYNEELRQFELTSPKTQKSIRTIGLDATTLAILWEWRQAQQDLFKKSEIQTKGPNQLIFTSANNHYLTETYLRRVIKRVTKRHDLPHITIHGFRHTHCSLLFEAGVEMHNVKNRLGHRDIQTTMNIYHHVTKAERDATADVFGEFMRKED